LRIRVENPQGFHIQSGSEKGFRILSLSKGNSPITLGGAPESPLVSLGHRGGREGLSSVNSVMRAGQQGGRKEGQMARLFHSKKKEENGFKGQISLKTKLRRSLTRILGLREG